MTTKSRRSHNKKAAWVLCNNYNGDWTAFSHPYGLTVRYMSRTLLLLVQYIHLYNTNEQRFDLTWSSSGAYIIDEDKLRWKH